MEDKPGNQEDEREVLSSESLPQEPQEAEVIRQIVRAESYRYAFPIPPPAWMEQYDRIVQGSAQRMMQDMHEQSQHRMNIERKEADANIRFANQGQWFGFVTAMTGFVVVMTAIIGGLALIYAGRSVGSGLTLALIGLAALAAVFVSNRWAPRQEVSEKEELTPVRQDLPPEG